MANPKNSTIDETEKLAERIRNLEGVVFAGTLGGAGLLSAACSCENCGCDSKQNSGCACNPNCTCQGHTADHLDAAMKLLLGAAAHVPLNEMKGLVDLRDKIRAARKLK